MNMNHNHDENKCGVCGEEIKKFGREYSQGKICRSCDLQSKSDNLGDCGIKFVHDLRPLVIGGVSW